MTSQHRERIRRIRAMELELTLKGPALYVLLVVDVAVTLAIAGLALLLVMLL
jgi:hypothetical protein